MYSLRAIVSCGRGCRAFAENHDDEHPPGFVDPTELALCRWWLAPTLQVVCRTKRLGGGFGGKESRSMFLSCVAALGAHLSGRPVRLSLDREVDMQITGHRHSFFAKYKAGASK